MTNSQPCYTTIFTQCYITYGIIWVGTRVMLDSHNLQM